MAEVDYTPGGHLTVQRMNVFILNTGRCGSRTFARACAHITNYTSAHESRSGLHQARLRIRELAAAMHD